MLALFDKPMIVIQLLTVKMTTAMRAKLLRPLTIVRTVNPAQIVKIPRIARVPPIARALLLAGMPGLQRLLVQKAPPKLVEAVVEVDRHAIVISGGNMAEVANVVIKIVEGTLGEDKIAVGEIEAKIVKEAKVNKIVEEIRTRGSKIDRIVEEIIAAVETTSAAEAINVTEVISVENEPRKIEANFLKENTVKMNFVNFI